MQDRPFDIKSVPTVEISLYMAGDLEQAKQVCREYCMDEGFCVTINPTSYIYTGGQEEGIVVGIRHYPRFPHPYTPQVIEDHMLVKAKQLGLLLRTRLCQRSVLIVAPTNTHWIHDQDG